MVEVVFSRSFFDTPVCMYRRYLSSKFWHQSVRLAESRGFSVACLAGTSSALYSTRLDDSRLVKAIVYEVNKDFCNSSGSTTRFSEFLDSQLSVHAGRLKDHEALQGLARDAKSYGQMSYEQRVSLLDKIAQIQGFSCVKDIIENEVAVAEASENLERADSNRSDASTSVPSAYVYGSSERIELFNFEKRDPRPFHVVKPKSEPAINDSSQPTLDKQELMRDKADKEDVSQLTPDRHNGSHEQGFINDSQPPKILKGATKKINLYHDDWKLDTPLSELKCFNAYQKSQLLENGFYTARSLLNHFPRAHINFESPTDSLEDDQVVSLIGTIVQTRAFQIAKQLALVEVIIRSNIGPPELENSVFLQVKKFYKGLRFVEHRFLHKAASTYREGSKAVVSGKVKAMKLKNHFEVKECYELKPVYEDFSQMQVYPVYPSKGLLHSKKIQKHIQRILSGLPSDLDPLPAELRTKYELLSLEEAYLGLHHPGTLMDSNLARRRIVFDDYFYLQLAFLLQRESPTETNILEQSKWCSLCLKVVNALPFKLTPGQIKAASEIMWDLRQPAPMSRLLQGDVGCGKTIVAFLVLLDVVNSGYQAALMAPTEFVVEQHYQRFLSWLQVLDEKDRPKVALLSGAVTAAEARLIREGIASREISLVIGTHTLISDATKFSALGLAVIDEQHRFGVEQRNQLQMVHGAEEKVYERDSKECNAGEGKVVLASTAHVLLMSATPIPRSLALTVHGDMSLSQITEIPPGRQPTETYVFSDETGRRTAYELVRSELKRGGKAFIVYPLITGSTPLRLAAVDEFGKVAEEFKDYKCVLAHGRMRSDVKCEELRKFNEGECQILVSTKVIEVGIDVSDATVMLVENAEAYGLAQLHQLRGRVGRGNKKSYCILLSSCESAMKRLKLLESTTDGFVLAEADLKMRGPGDLLGKRQSGSHIEFVLAKLGEDNDILEQARSAAMELLTTCDRSLDVVPKLKQELDIRQLPKSWS